MGVVGARLKERVKFQNIGCVIGIGVELYALRVDEQMRLVFGFAIALQQGTQLKECLSEIQPSTLFRQIGPTKPCHAGAAHRAFALQRQPCQQCLIFHRAEGGDDLAIVHDMKRSKK